MNKTGAKGWLAVSLVANVVAAILLLKSSHNPAPARVNETDHSKGRKSSPLERTAARPATPSGRSDSTLIPFQADTNTLPEIWSRVAVADYKEFAANLRAIGMPEDTVRDIVMMDLFKSLGDELGTLAHGIGKPFWQVAAYGPKPPLVTGEVQHAVTQLVSISREVLGIDPQTWFLNSWGWVELAASGDTRNFESMEEMFDGLGSTDEYGWLSPGRYRELQLVNARQATAERELQRKIDATTDEADREALNSQLEALEEIHERALEDFLTPEEKRERDLRDDAGLRSQLAGVEVSREEYERLHDLARSCGASNAPYFRDGTPEAAQALGILGADRFAEFQRGADEKYGRLLSVCAACEVPPATARKLDEMRRECERKVEEGMPILEARNAAVEAGRALLGDKYENMQGYFSGCLPSFTNYQLKPGETLESVAEQFGVPVGQIMQASGIAPGAVLQPGQEIQIPED